MKYDNEAIVRHAYHTAEGVSSTPSGLSAVSPRTA